VARAALLLTVLISAIVGLVFAVAPSLDVDLAKFFLQAHQQGPLREILPSLFSFRDIAEKVPYAAAALALAVIILKLVNPRRAMVLPSRATVLLLATLAVGPVLVSNVLLKDHWSRPRPREITELGGTQQFRPWWDPRGSCKRNCSFVSGEVSAAFSFLAPAAMMPGPWSYVAIGSVTAYGLMIGYIRIIAGGHFFTDVVFAASLTALIVWLLHGLLCRWERTRVTDQSLDNAIGEAALMSRDAVARKLAAIDAAVRKMFRKR
jgi:membrane-associated phospholipid phosphatase